MFFKNEKDDDMYEGEHQNLLPLLPLRDIIIFPHMVVPLFVGRKKSINALEKELGKTLLAFSCHDLRPSGLTGDELSRIEEVEKQLGVSLVAVDH